MKRSPLNRPLKDQQQEAELFRQRAQIGYLVIVVLTVLLGARYLWLQLWQHEDFETRSESNRVQVRSVPPNRGVIYDRRGRVIADNQPAWRLEVIPENAGDLEQTLAELGELIVESYFIDQNHWIFNFNAFKRSYNFAWHCSYICPSESLQGRCVSISPH